MILKQEWLIDSHAHLSDANVLAQIESIVERAKKANISHIINICTDIQTLEEGLILCEKYPHIKNTAATTPHDAKQPQDPAFSFFAKCARQNLLVAIGETGLDYHYKELDPQIQKKFLIPYLHLAAECHLPVIFHCREAFHDLFAIADLEYPRTANAILHCFTGTPNEAEEVIKRGWYLSFSGIVTFKNSASLREVAKFVPLSKLLIETDTPFLAPQSKRGKPNEPSFLPEIAACIADVKKISVEEVAKSTSENATRLFLKKGNLVIDPSHG